MPPHARPILATSKRGSSPHWRDRFPVSQTFPFTDLHVDALDGVAMALQVLDRELEDDRLLSHAERQGADRAAVMIEASAPSAALLQENAARHPV